MQDFGTTGPRLQPQPRISAVFICLLLCTQAGCAVVQPGYAAVRLSPSGTIEALGEGIHVVPPFSQVDQFDLRSQERDENLRALTADGAPVAAHTSLVTYHLIPEELSTLDRQVGPEYYRILIQPIVRSTVRRVLAKYGSAEINAAVIANAQQEITQLAAERLRPYHIGLDAIDLKLLAIMLSERSYAQVTQRGVLEQQLLAMPQNLEVTRQQGEARREAGRAITAAHALVAPTLTPGVLVDSRRRAELDLLTSPASTVVIADPGQPYQLEVVP